MITLEMNFKDETRKINLKEEILFNALLSKNDKLIKKLIKHNHPFYKISGDFYEVVNKYVDIKEDGSTLYGGLIVRTSFDTFAVLYLEDTEVDDDYIIKTIDEFIHDTGENIARTVTVNKIEITHSLFIKVTK